MTVSVLIATLDRAPLLERCLRALLACAPRPDEILVADQSSGGETCALVERLAAGHGVLRYLHVAPRGKARALNVAIAASRGELLALTDDDVIVPSGWIATLVGLAERHPDAAGFCGQVLPEPGTRVEDYLNLVLSREPRWLDRATDPVSPSFCGANIAVRRATMLAVGGYDANFGPGGRLRNNDDGELAYRITRGGGRILFAPELEVVHSGWRREADNRRLVLDYAFGMGAFAGYRLRRADPRPLLHLLPKLGWKAARAAYGVVTWSRLRVSDGAVHVRGFVHGFCRGFVTPAQPGLAVRSEGGA